MTLSALIAALLLTPQTAPQMPESPLPDVVVEGRVLEGEALEDLARDFIGEVAAPPRGFSVARWHRSVCVGVVNLPNDAARFVADRVSAVAFDVGLEPGRPGCRPEVVIVGTTNAVNIASELVERRRRTFLPGGDGFSRSRAALERFATDDRPVRWWHVSQPTDPRTGLSASYRPGSGFYASPAENIPQIAVVGSLLASPIRQDLTRAIVIVDFDQLDGVDFNQLADYLAFVSLSQVDPEADTSQAPTILNLFDDSASVSGLTDWDRAYLRGLYNSDAAAPTAISREGAIRREMLRAREQAQEAEADTD